MVQVIIVRVSESGRRLPLAVPCGNLKLFWYGMATTDCQ